MISIPCVVFINPDCGLIMDNRIFSNNEAARITETTPRQVLSWTERGMIIPYRETSGTGIKRGYSYVNLLEIYLCDILIKRHFNFQKIKEILSWLRTSGHMVDWATNFEKWHSEAVKKQIDHFQGLLDNAKKTKSSEVTVLEPLLEITKKMKPTPPKESTGVLIISYMDQREECSLLPYSINDAMKNFVHYYSKKLNNIWMFDVVNLGKIKSVVDEKLK